MPKTDIFDLPSYTITVPAEPITMLALRGGGAKGAAFPGAILALEELNVLKKIETVAGSSVGSFMALMLALGYSAKEIEEKSKEMNFLKFLDVSNKNNLADRGICDGKILYETIQELILTKIQQHINICENEILMQNTNMPDTVREANLRILEKLATIKRKEKITFADLEFINQTYRIFNPDNIIKDLIVTGTNITDSKLAIFSAKSTPTMEIALAIRISASFPIVFKAVTYKGKQYIDGGASDNLPVRVINEYSNDKNFKFLTTEQQRQRTLSLTLGKKLHDNLMYKGTEAYRTGILPTILNYLSRAASTVSYFTNLAELMQSLQSKYALRTIALPTQGITTLTPNPSLKKRDELRVASSQVTKEYFNNHREEAVHYKEKDFQSCLLQAVRSPQHLKLIDHLAQPFLNQDTNKNDKYEIKAYVNKFASETLKINQEKDKIGEELITEIEHITQALDKFITVYANPAIRNAERLNSITENDKVIEPGLLKIQEQFNNYCNVFDLQKNSDSSLPRHQEIMLERLKPYQKIFNNFLDNLAVYRFAHKHSNLDPVHQAKVIAITDSTAGIFTHFQLERKKDDLLAVLIESKAKYFQRSANVKVLSKAIEKIAEAKSIKEIQHTLNHIHLHYKPRTFFSFSASIKHALNIPHSFDTLSRLDAVMNNTSPVSGKKSRK